MKYFFFILISLTFSLSYSQIYILPNSIDTTNQVSSNNTIVINGFNVPSQGGLEYESINLPTSINVSLGDTLSGFLYDDIGTQSVDLIKCYSSNGYLSHLLTQSMLVPAHLKFTVTNYVSPSNDSINDGSVVLVFDSADVKLNYSLTIYNTNGNLDDTTWLDNFSLKIDSLIKGTFHTYIVNPLNSNDLTFVDIYMGNPNDIYVNTGMEMSFGIHHADQGCDGWIVTQADNAIGPVYNAWDDNLIYNTFSRTNLCPGVYSVYTYDIVNNEYNFGSIDTFVITNNNLTYIDSSLFTNTVQDTVYNFTSNCNFDFNAPIDSINYIEDTLFNQGGMVIVNYSMTLFQGLTFVVITDSMTILNDSLIMLDVVIYCDQGSNKTGFQGQRILYLRGVDSHNFYQNETAGFFDKDKVEVKLFPNPTTSELNLRFENKGKSKIEICSINGNLLNELECFDQSISIPVDKLESGVYFMRISQNNQYSVLKFIKK